MCGIAGVLSLNKDPVSSALIKEMSGVITHRGPDDQGYYIDENLAFAHRRLSIIDLSPAAHQPMANEDATVVMVYNGEIYNYQELRTELTSRGHRFHSHTDSETVIHSYEEWGLEALKKFNGMFAFALWDKARRRIILARDRYGIKPLYYAFVKNKFVFSSEIKAILLHPEYAKDVDYQALKEYFTFQNVYSDRTLFGGIRLLPAGHYITLDEKGGAESFSMHSYWGYERLFAPNPLIMDEREYIEKLQFLFEQSVIRQLMSDVPLGSYLSGGMDSGSIVAVASKNLPRLMTFTGGYDLSSVSGIELVFDEREHAELLSSTFLTEHYEMVLHAGDMAWALPRLIWHIEDLRVGMCYQNYYIARLASKFVKVVLSGAGGDELFAGYPWRYEKILECESDDHFDRIYYEYWQRLIPEAEHDAFFTESARKRIGDYSSFDAYRQVLKGAGEAPGGGERREHNLNRALYFDAKTFLHGLFVIEDKVSMAHSLETRVPFLDNDLVDFALSMPSRHKLLMTSSKGDEVVRDTGNEVILQSNKGKYILREAMRKLTPVSILNLKKQGFSPPDGSWYRGESMNYVRQILLDRRTLTRGFFEPSSIERIVDEHTRGLHNHRLIIWSLLSFEWWNRLFMDGDREDIKSGRKSS
ncbi:MAG: asparagine synthase (glutamine-hydrolyzing) [Candidatus Eremiobacteraeota bacterium]|nr:asparagine synthase (glutamine-hydrolyzing) [Candidatus Eremiobacteraeota bacterium]